MEGWDISDDYLNRMMEVNEIRKQMEFKNYKSKLRRTGRTTVLMAEALSKFISTGECELYDHNMGIDMTTDMRSWIKDEFLDRLNGFFSREGCINKSWIDIIFIPDKSIYEVKINKNHPMFDIIKNRVLDKNGKVVKWSQ